MTGGATYESAPVRFHHVGIACRDIRRECALYEAMGFSAEGAVFEDPTQRVRGVFLVSSGYRVELLEPLRAGEPSPLDPYLSRGFKLYHQAFTVNDIAATSQQLVAAGAVVTVPPVPAVAFAGRSISFLMLPAMNLVELVEAG